MSDPLSLRAYARHRKENALSGGTLKAIQDAVATGRVILDANGKIPDAAEADARWRATTHAEKRPLTGPAGSADVEDLADARARLDAARASLAELDLAERRAELVPARDVEAKLVGVFASCKTKLLGIPSRARQQDPSLSVDQIALLESLTGEALEDLALEGADDE